MSEGGPISAERATSLRATVSASEGGLTTFLNHTHVNNEERLLNEFCEAEEVSEKLTTEDRRPILHYFQRANLQTAKAAL